MYINTGKTQVMTNYEGHFKTGVFLHGEEIKEVELLNT